MSVPASLLAIDSSTERLAVALHAGGRLFVGDEAGGQAASARIVPLVMGMLAEAGITLTELDAIGFARGPGAFTGLRTACAVAQGLAFGAGKPVLSLDSLLLVAVDAHVAAGAPASFDVWVTMDARMSEVYAGHYRYAAGEWRAIEPAGLHDLDTLHARWQQTPPMVVAGSALAAFGERLHTAGALRCPAERSRAAALMALAQAAWARGEAMDAALALPLYLRDKVALTTVERAAVAAMKAA